MSLDPIRTTQAITNSYLDYLSTTFRLQDSELHAQFEQLLRIPGKFVKGPVLEATPPFVKGATIRELVNSHVLSPRFLELNTGKLPVDRPLYFHQQQAIEKTVRDKRNIVVATGTGSGKTEAFLVPILETLFEQTQREKLTPGVRALLLYPMNALANDQLSRLRDLLENFEEITFGRYTGETKESEQEALDLYRKMYHREPRHNELISREAMRNKPPHILLTNYAMLEYLLLRPDDNVFFDGLKAGNWRFIVVDEAHTFTGAKGIEMAMLLRRLKDRVVNGQSGRLQCIATSATIGSDDSAFPLVTKFAERLFGERFEWADADEKRQDVVKSLREPMGAMSSMQWVPDSTIYPILQGQANRAQSDTDWDFLVRVSLEAGFPQGVIDFAVEVGKSHNTHQAFLYEILKRRSKFAPITAGS